MIEKQSIFMGNVANLIAFIITTKGYKVTGGELYRTKEQQQIYFEQGKTRTLNSKHLKRLAIDLNIFINGRLVYDKAKLQEIGDYWEALHPDNSWGGNWKSFVDTPHFQMT